MKLKEIWVGHPKMEAVVAILENVIPVKREIVELELIELELIELELIEIVIDKAEEENKTHAQEDVEVVEIIEVEVDIIEIN